ncbi:MAG: DUF2867 domain-containing protein [Chloroflexi bacterium]|nr:DUF2867 domain-containing protein [Chloroflexota bacterium]
MARSVLVLGASGYIGTHLVPRLAARGYRVRAASRRREALEARGWEDVEVVRADALDEESLSRALDGVEIAWYLVHSMAAGADFAARDRRAAGLFAAAAERAGLRRIIYVGGLQPPQAASPHLSSRRETGERLRAGSVPVTEIRAGIVVGPGSAAFEVIRDLVYHLPVMVTPRWVRSRSQPIALDDLVEILVRLPEHEGSAGRIYDAAGPETLTYEELLRQFAGVVGRPLRIVPVPILSPRLSSWWLDLVTSVPARIARPLIDGLKHDLLSERGNEIEGLLPSPPASYRQAVRAALHAEEAAAVPIRWTEGAFRLRQQRHDISYYGKSVRYEARCEAPPARAWAPLAAIGGERGWYYANVLWRLRGLLDRLLGGAGMRRGRRHPAELRAGDPLDFWRVAAVEPGRRLTLVAEMRLPGSAILELAVEPRGGQSAVVLEAHFHPAGAPGLLYWYALWPVHRRIFERLPRAIAERAERGGV